MLKKYPKYFRILISENKEETVSINRLKACSSFPYNISPVNIDLLYPGERVTEGIELENRQIPSPQQQTTENPETNIQDELLDIEPGILAELFKEPEDPLETGVTTRVGRQIKLPRKFLDYEL